MPSNTALVCLKEVLEELVKFENYIAIEGANIFAWLAVMIRNIVQEGRLDDQMFTVASILLKLCLPKTLQLS